MIEVELATSFRYLVPATRIHAGPGALSQVGTEAERLGSQRAFILCGGSVARETDLLDQIRQSLGHRYAGSFSGVRKESPLPAVEACVAAAREAGADLLIAVGGGSAVVTTRAAVILLAEAGSAHDLCTQYPPGKPPVSPRLMRPKLPNISVLTTPTTAASAGGGAVRDPAQRRRLELFDPKSRPAAVILDPAALGTAPLGLYLNTAVTTLVTTVEGLLCPGVNGFSCGDLAQALALSLEYLPKLVRRPDDSSVRIQLAVASLLRSRAAEALPGSGHGIATGLVHALQGRYDHFPQGHAAAAVLGPGMRFTGVVPAPGHPNLTAALGVGREGSEGIAMAASAVTDLLRDLGVPVRLRDLQIPQSDLEAVAQDAMGDFFVRINPRPVNAQEALTLLREAW